MTEGGLTLELLAGSATRSLVLGASVFAIVKLARLRDLSAETMIWTAVLFVAMAMPLLSILSPAGVSVALPHMNAPHLAAGLALSDRPASPDLWTRLLGWSAGRAVQAAWTLYATVAFVGLARLAAGLIFVARLYGKADPIHEDWARGRNIRVSAAVEAPLSLADCILLPADYHAWSMEKRLAVLAHEEAHIQRGDFFIHLLASIHRALFWFSPFAWWLQSKLRELAETASDKVAMRRIDDPTAYAEILLEVSRRPHRAPAAMAMARGPGIAKRVDHILSGPPERSMSAPARVVSLVVVMAASLGLAQVHAALAVTPSRLQAAVAAASPQAQAAVLRTVSPATPVHGRAATPRRRVAAIPKIDTPSPASAPAPQPDFTYNPRALLEDPGVAVVSALLPLGDPDRKSVTSVSSDLAATIGPAD